MAALGGALSSPVSMAAVSDAEFQALKDSVAVLTQKLSEVERDLVAERERSAQTAKEVAKEAAAQAVASSQVAKPSPASWTEKVSLQGDLRARYENVDVENADDDRNRSRLRARAAIIARPQDGLEVGFGLSTRQDASPTSGNQTMGDGGSGKDIYLDLAYFNWAAVEGMQVMGGKFKNNIYRPGRHALIWDGDLNPEGFGMSYRSGPFFANAIGAWMESDSDSDAGNAMALGGQAGVAWPLTDTVNLTAGAGYFHFNTEGKGGFYGVDGETKFYGNSVDSNDRYLYDYDVLEAFAELGFKAFGQPVSVFVDYANNGEADRFDTGWATGLVVGAAKAKGTWEAGYVYQDLERDAVFGLWTDSDFGGGGTDNKGHILRGTYALSDKTTLGFSYYMSEIGENVGNEKDHDLLQIDLGFKY